MKRSFIILFFHILSLVQPFSLQSQTTIIKVDDFLYEKGIQLIEKIIIGSIPKEYSLISDIILIGIQDILDDNNFVIISYGSTKYEEDFINGLPRNKECKKDSLSLQIKGIESKAMPGYGLFRLNPFLFQK